MARFLLEIGIEELPAGFAHSVFSQLESIIKSDLKINRISYSSINCSGTPRRIFVEIIDLSEFTDNLVEERKGPPASAAYNDGNPSKAAFGFAKRNDLDVTELFIKSTNKGDFVFAKYVEPGKPSIDSLTCLIPKWIASIQGSRFMRWGNGNYKFSRPIRWIVCLLDDVIIPLTFSDFDPTITSGRTTRGHRLFSNNIEISHPNEYQILLSKNGVIVDRQDRYNIIKELVIDFANANNVVLDSSEKLLFELTDLVEFPSLVIGNFDKKFLSLPPEVLATVMKVHQRYIPLYVNSTCDDVLLMSSNDVLIPKFICISNASKNSNKIVQRGNERVLYARFSDAEFFLNADLSITSDERCHKLNEVTFAEGLGSLYDRVDRIKWISELITFSLSISDLDKKYLITASQYCKHDLVSHMVIEFPELQGCIGGKYLLYENLPKEVALAVSEHYLPAGYGDKLPSSLVGALLSITEKLELLISIFSQGQRPTGSSDPYALRRSCHGIFLIIWNYNLTINIDEVLRQSIIHWSKLFPDFKIEYADVLRDLERFIHLKIINLVEEIGIDYDIVQSVCGQSIPTKILLSNPLDILVRAKLLMEMRKNGQLSIVQSVVSRASKLASKGNLPPDIISPNKCLDINLFQQPSEYKIFDILQKLEPIVISNDSGKYNQIAEILADSYEALSSFFDGEDSVMVMVDNEPLRKNRLNLLSLLHNQSKILADFCLIAQ